MKTLLLAATLLTTLSAQASFMSKRCSNADSTIITQSGHGANSITVHEYSQVVSSEKLPVKLDMRDINITSSEEKTLFSKTTNGCVEGERFGFGSSDSISAKKITITNKDGSAFPVSLYSVNC